MVRMCELMEDEAIEGFLKHSEITLYEEYIFSGLNGAKDYSDLDDYLLLLSKRYAGLDTKEYRGYLEKGIEAAARIVKETADEIIALDPKVVAASSLFRQHNATLAILRRVRELDPRIRTLMGGPNCEGRAGEALLKFFPQVDAVFFGEGDEVFDEAVKGLMEDAPLPFGVLRREDVAGGQYEGKELPYRLTKDMDRIPYPDYDDFMPLISRITKCRPALKEGFYDSKGNTLIMMEGSRGCYWGQKRACTFCALNGEHNVYRRKSAERVHDEMMYLTKRYGMNVVEFTDNVLSFETINNLLPLMKKYPGRFSVMAEVKPNLREEVVSDLKEAGFSGVQAGIENLNTHLIKLLGKGNNAAGHIAFMKHAKKYGIVLIWNFLYGIPGEETEDYVMLYELLPQLYHLQPPMASARVMFERGSVYASDPESFEIEFEPDALYRFLYGKNEDFIRSTALYYDVSGGRTKERFRETEPYYKTLRMYINQWRKIFFSPRGCDFSYKDNGEYLTVKDTRPVSSASFAFIAGAERQLMLLSDIPVLEDRAVLKTEDSFGGKETLRALESLKKRGYVLALDGFLICPALKL